MESKETISKEEFLKLPVGKSENKVLDFFEENPDEAFKYLLISEKIGLKKSAVYVALNNLIRIKLIEKRGEYYCLKD